MSAVGKPSINPYFRRRGDALFSHDDAWEVIKSAFRANSPSVGLGSFHVPHPIVGSQVNSYNNFIRHSIPDIIQQNSPVRMEIVEERRGTW